MSTKIYSDVKIDSDRELYLKCTTCSAEYYPRELIDTKFIFSITVDELKAAEAEHNRAEHPRVVGSTVSPISPPVNDFKPTAETILPNISGKGRKAVTVLMRRRDWLIQKQDPERRGNHHILEEIKSCDWIINALGRLPKDEHIKCWALLQYDGSPHAIRCAGAKHDVRHILSPQSGGHKFISRSEYYASVGTFFHYEEKKGDGPACGFESEDDIATVFLAEDVSCAECKKIVNDRINARVTEG